MVYIESYIHFIYLFIYLFIWLLIPRFLSLSLSLSLSLFFFFALGVFEGIPRWCNSKESTCQCRRYKRHSFNTWVRKIPWRRKWQTTPVFLPGKSHGQRSLVGYSPWDDKESHRTEDSITHIHIWEIVHGLSTVVLDW